MIGLLLGVLACGPAEAPAPSVAPPPPVAPVPARAPASPEGEQAPVRVLHARVDRDRVVPAHVSATWVADGLQLMLTGLPGPCEPAPSFVAKVTPTHVRLVEQPAPPPGPPCSAQHTLMLQLDGQVARDLEIEVLLGSGASFGSTRLAATDH